MGLKFANGPPSRLLFYVQLDTADQLAMPLTKEFQFPSDEELTVPEVNISASYLRAGSIHLGKYCEQENDEFMLCKSELKDPRKCLAEGRAVTNCTLKFFQAVKKNCAAEFNQYANCLYKSSADMNLRYCKNTQAVFDKCVLDKMNFTRPPFGWQCEVHIHHTDRPKPKREITHYPDAASKYDPEVMPPQAPRFGIRH